MYKAAELPLFSFLKMLCREVSLSLKNTPVFLIFS